MASTTVRASPVARGAAPAARAALAARAAPAAAPAVAHARLGRSSFAGQRMSLQALSASTPAPRAAATMTHIVATSEGRMSAADSTRTIMEVARKGTLSTVDAAGIPYGTYAGYVMDKAGVVVLRLRASAMHTANIQNDPRCSLYVESNAAPGAAMSRVTLVGSLVPVEDGSVEGFAASYAERHAGSKGVDATSDDDLYYRLDVSKALFVGGYSGAAEEVSPEDLLGATPDVLKDVAFDLVRETNERRLEDVVRYAVRSGMDAADLIDVQMTGLDCYGFDISCVNSKREVVDARIAFARPVIGEEDARSTLTMMAQESWEMERNYSGVKASASA